MKCQAIKLHSHSGVTKPHSYFTKTFKYHKQFHLYMFYFYHIKHKDP